MRCRIFAAAMLFHNDDLLMMKRSIHRTLNPGMWAAVGGHLEPDEIAVPREACLREIKEETGFTASDIHDLTLRYVLLRNNAGEIRHQYIYSALVTRRDFVDSEEGTLHWIPQQAVLDRSMPYVYEQTLRHYFSGGSQSSHPWVGIANRGADGREAQMSWVPLNDPLV